MRAGTSASERSSSSRELGRDCLLAGPRLARCRVAQLELKLKRKCVMINIHPDSRVLAFKRKSRS